MINIVAGADDWRKRQEPISDDGIKVEHLKLLKIFIIIVQNVRFEHSSDILFYIFQTGRIQIQEKNRCIFGKKLHSVKKISIQGILHTLKIQT